MSALNVEHIYLMAAHQNATCHDIPW